VFAERGREMPPRYTGKGKLIGVSQGEKTCTGGKKKKQVAGVIERGGGGKKFSSRPKKKEVLSKNLCPEAKPKRKTGGFLLAKGGPRTLRIFKKEKTRKRRASVTNVRIRKRCPFLSWTPRKKGGVDPKF